MINETLLSSLESTISANFSNITTYTKHASIKNIFLDNYAYIKELAISNKLSADSFKNVQMMLLCSTHYLGYSVYECPNCGEEHAIHNTCHSRFCNRCGAKYARQRAAHVSSICLDIKHRHIVFTIPKHLRYFFAKYRDLLDLLFIASRNTLLSLFNRSYLNKQIRHARKLQRTFTYPSTYLFKDTPNLRRFAAISSLHTFGRDLKFSPHIHCLVAEAYYDPEKDELIPFHYFNYKSLRKTWQYQLLNLLKPYLSNSFYQLLYNRCTNGFYVYAKDNKEFDLLENDSEGHSKNIQNCMAYALRYTGRPPMAESRITNYDSSNRTVTWHYTPHENEEETVIVEDDAKDFICKLLLHMPRPQFRMVRYYGLYANACHKLLSHVHQLINENSIKANQSKREAYKRQLLHQLTYRNLLISTFQIDPLLCTCGHIMQYVKTYSPFDKNGKKVINDDNYRNDCLNEMRKLPPSRRRATLDSRGIAFHGHRSNQVN